MRFGFFFTAFLVGFATLIVTPGLGYAADEISLSAGATPDTMPPGETFTLTISVTGQGLNSLPDPNLSKLDRFEIVGRASSQQISMINFTTSVTKKITYQILVPPETEDGTYTLPEITLAYKSKNYKADPIKITVDKNAPPPTRARSTGRRNRFFPNMDGGFFSRPETNIDKDDIIVKLETDKKQVVPFEPIVVTFSYLRSIRMFSQPSYEKPNFAGFWVEELTYPDGEAQKDFSTRENGRNYQVTSLRYLLIPLSTGEHVIDSAKLHVSLGAFGQRKTLITKPVAITVFEFPDKGKPASFAGMVGTYNIVSETIPNLAATSSVKVNNSITLKITITGEGYLKPLPAPEKPVVEHFEVFDAKVTDEMEKKGGMIISTRVIEFPMIAKTVGNATIPAIPFSWFHPETAKYISKTTDPVTIKVERSDTPATLQTTTIKKVERGLAYLKPDVAELSDWSEPLYLKWWFITLALLPIPALIIVFRQARHKERLYTNADFARRSGAHKTVMSRLDTAGSVDTEEEFYARVDKALRGYLGDIWSLPAPSITKESLYNLDNRMTDEMKVRITKLIDTLELSRYAPLEGGGRESILNEMRAIVSALEMKR